MQLENAFTEIKIKIETNSGRFSDMAFVCIIDYKFQKLPKKSLEKSC